MKCRSSRAWRRSMSATSRFALDLREDAMAAVEMHQRVAMAALARHSSACSRAVSADSSRSRRSTAICLRALEMLFGQRQLAQLARDRSEVLLDLAERDRVARLRRERSSRARTPPRAATKSPRADLELGAIHFESECAPGCRRARRRSAPLLRTRGRVVPALEVRAQHAHVVAAREDFLRRAERAEFGEARAIVAQRLLVVAADHRDDAQVGAVIAARRVSPASSARPRASR